MVRLMPIRLVSMVLSIDNFFLIHGPHNMPELIKILLVDDHQIVIDGVKSLLRKANNIEIVAEALNGNQALEILRNKAIDLMITDIQMPGMDGLTLTQKVKEEMPEIKVLVLSMYQEHEIVNQIFMSNAEGFILKNTGKKELISAIQKIIEGSTYYSREVLSILMEKVIKKPTNQPNVQPLTPREKEILKLIGKEYSTAEIAEALHISPRTVDTHRKHIMQKTESKTIVGLIRLSIANDWL